MFKYAALLSAISLAPVVLAQSSAWGQCGGKGWAGPTACVTGYTCTFSNEYYSQCLPGAATTSTRPITTSSSTRGPTTTAITTTTKPVTTSTGSTSAPASTTTGGSTPAPSGNPYAGRSVYVSPYYAAEVEAAAATITDSALKAKYAKIANTPTFIWFDVAAKVPDLKTYVADAKSKNQVLQIVVYDLPERDCSALSSNGELSIANDGVNKYKAYIDAIAAATKGSGVTVVAVVEPDSLGNLVTNMGVPKCQTAAPYYRDLTVYAMKTLNDAGVYMYLDAGHAGWLGWPDNLSKAAALFSELYKLAGSPKYVRGFATNVSNYNALVAASPDPATQGNANYDEIHYIRAFAPALASAGFPAHFIVDQSRSGVQNLRSKWGNWCNIKGAGFGTRPTTSTPDSLIDAIVWVKPGGESDGTSDQTSKRYDSTCGLSDAFQPAPEAGTWFQAYFNALVVNANPSL